jgi:hypothetical protein
MVEQRPSFQILRSKSALAAGGLVVFGAMVLGSPLVANGSSSYFTWFQSSSTPQNVWHSITTGATYNGATVESGYTAYAADVSINGVVSTAIGTVRVSFAYKQVVAKCQWRYPLTPYSDTLTCRLSY